MSRIGFMMQVYVSKDPSMTDLDSWFSWKHDRIEEDQQSAGAFASTEQDFEADRAANLALMKG